MSLEFITENMLGPSWSAKTQSRCICAPIWCSKLISSVCGQFQADVNKLQLQLQLGVHKLQVGLHKPQVDGHTL